MKIKAVDFVAYEVEDVARSIGFYRDVLGLELLYFNDGADWAEFVINGVTLSLCGPLAGKWGAPRAPAAPVRSEASVAFAVEDLDAAVDELGQKEVPFLGGIRDTGVCRFAVALDPDGNRVWLHQGYAEYHSVQ